jgi:ABC-type bacteriocin/lantibiotic exporter with double-glycine peptidase domain
MKPLGTTEFNRSVQSDDYTCGVHCVKMAIKHFTKQNKDLATLIAELGTTESKGTTVEKMVEVLRSYGLRVNVMPNVTLWDLNKVLRRGSALIVHVDGDHFSILHGKDKNWYYIADPDPNRPDKIAHKTFKKRWGRWAISITGSESA